MIKTVSLIAPTKAFAQSLRNAGIKQPMHIVRRSSPMLKGAELLQLLRKANLHK